MIIDIHERVKSCLWALFISYITAIDASLEEVERHLDLGKQFLSKGQFADALTHYHAAVDLDPENYLTRYRRATALLALGKSKSAMPDLDKVISLKPDFYAARLQRGNVLLKQGEWDSAYADFENVLANEPSNAEAQQKLDSIMPAKENIDMADELAETGDVFRAEKLYSAVLDVSPWNPEVHSKRADCYEAMGDIRKAIGDVHSVTKLVADSKQMLYRLSKLHYSLGEIEESLNQIRECLKLDPDDKQCFPHYKKVKKMAKTLGDMYSAMERENYEECVAKAKRILDSEKNVPLLERVMHTHLCKCYSKGGGEPSQAIESCTIALEGGPDPDVLCDRAEAHLNNDAYEEAIADFQEALKVDENYNRAKEGQQRAQRLQKQSQKRDYYKILGVKRNARKKEIMKAYRKLAQKWHPDAHPEQDKKMAEKKFMDIAAAKEVLTDPEKRAKFDAGEDPLDASQQQGGWQHPFFGGFDPFGGGGGNFHFKFDFN